MIPVLAGIRFLCLSFFLSDSDLIFISLWPSCCLRGRKVQYRYWDFMLTLFTLRICTDTCCCKPLLQNNCTANIVAPAWACETARNNLKKDFYRLDKREKGNLHLLFCRVNSKERCERRATSEELPDKHRESDGTWNPLQPLAWDWPWHTNTWEEWDNEKDLSVKKITWWVNPQCDELYRQQTNKYRKYSRRNIPHLCSTESWRVAHPWPWCRTSISRARIKRIITSGKKPPSFQKYSCKVV